jgi:hypothetical protein
MSDKPIVVPPGMLVTLATRVEPPPKYEREEIREPELSADGTETEQWKTTKIIIEREEFDEATAARLKVRALIGAACIKTSFGFLCPTENLPKLDAAFAEARQITDSFNAGSTTYKVKWASLRGQIAESQAEAVAAIKSEVSGLLAEMEAAMKAGEVGKLRSLASKANSLGPLLGPEKTQGRDLLGRAVTAYRRVARAIVAKVEKEGEDLAAVLHEANMSPVAQARFLFEAAPEDEEKVAASLKEALAEGLEPETEPEQESEPEQPAAPTEGEDGMLIHDQGAGEVGEVAAPETEPISGPEHAQTVAAGIIEQLESALKQFGEYSFDDKGPDEVMDTDAIRSQIDALPAEEAAAVLQALCDHSERGIELAGSLLNMMDSTEMDDDRWAALVSVEPAAQAGGYGKPTAEAKTLKLTKAGDLGSILAGALEHGKANIAEAKKVAAKATGGAAQAYAESIGEAEQIIDALQRVTDQIAPAKKVAEASGEGPGGDAFRADVAAVHGKLEKALGDATDATDPAPVEDARFDGLDFGEPEETEQEGGAG